MEPKVRMTRARSFNAMDAKIQMSPVVSWLLDRRARLDGHAEFLQEIDALRTQLKDVVDRRGALDETIAQYSKKIDVNAIKPIRRQNVSKNYASMAAAIRSPFAAHPRMWLPTSAIVIECAALVGKNITNSCIASYFRIRITKELGQFARRGDIIRRHNPRSNDEGFWGIIYAPTTTAAPALAPAPTASMPAFGTLAEAQREEKALAAERTSRDPDGGPG
jgi:hypothetical protein